MTAAARAWRVVVAMPFDDRRKGFVPQEQIRWLVGWVGAMVAWSGFLVQVLRLRLGKGRAKMLAFWAMAFVAALFIMP